MEVAGLGPSKQIALVKARDKPVGLGLQVTSCGVGILVTEIDQHGSAAQSGERRARRARAAALPGHAVAAPAPSPNPITSPLTRGGVYGAQR